MFRFWLLIAAMVIAAVVASDTWMTSTHAQMATPTAHDAATVILVEHADLVSEIDLGEPGPSPGDMLVWGPNALFDQANVDDTGATTQGMCIAFNTAADCIASETIVFADGSTLEFQGIERAGGLPSARTIVGGSGRYLGAIGTMAAAPSEDLSLWTKTIAIDFAAPLDHP